MRRAEEADKKSEGAEKKSEEADKKSEEANGRSEEAIGRLEEAALALGRSDERTERSNRPRSANDVSADGDGQVRVLCRAVNEIFRADGPIGEFS